MMKLHSCPEYEIKNKYWPKIVKDLVKEFSAAWKVLSPFCMNVTRYQKSRYCNYGEAEVYVKCNRRNCPLLKGSK